ncbi:FAD-dependent oxidoreductase [bacterium]|nr:FAD-dependent oxidoreductase [bacterium]
MRIAVIGTGISGLMSAYLLAEGNELTLFESNDYVGGHSNTVQVSRPGGSVAVDTGFITYNERNYPLFTRLLRELNVATQATTMSFSVRDDQAGIEYNGETLGSLFAQRRNLFRPSFWGMIRDILRFNREAPGLVDRLGEGPTLGEFLEANHFGKAFVDRYLVPMAAAIWSAEPRQIGQFPAKYFVRFFQNHGLLTVSDQPIWRTIVGGSRCYVDRLIEKYRHGIRLSTPVRSIRRESDRVMVTTDGAADEVFDQVVIAVHADQALRMLADPSPDEQRVLSSFRYQSNDTVLHTQASVLPHRKLAWASWNYWIPPEPTSACTVTYNMNKLHGFDDHSETFCVTLNPNDRLAEDQVIQRFLYEHPIYAKEAFDAQHSWSIINGVRRTYFAGAYWGYGFHEDGVRSGLAVAEQMGRTW